jgi:hypothetical protein
MQIWATTKTTTNLQDTGHEDHDTTGRSTMSTTPTGPAGGTQLADIEQMDDVAAPQGEAQARGPLRIPIAPGGRVEVRLALTERLKGHTTSAGWLPAGLSPELDELRTNSLRLRGRAANDLRAMEQLHREQQDEDRKHQVALQHALRDGEGVPEDRRTSPEVRQSQHANLQERLDADILVMAEVADKIIEKLREQEPNILGTLRVGLNGAQDKRREAERLIAEAESEEWRIHRLGQWVLTTSEDGPLGRQPAPTPQPMPAQFDRALLATSLKRPWHRPLTPPA